MGASWRPFAGLEGERATSSEDHDEKVEQAASKGEYQDDHARGCLTRLLDDRCKVKCQSDRAVHNRAHNGPWLTDHDKAAYQQRRKSEQKSQ